MGWDDPEEEGHCIEGKRAEVYEYVLCYLRILSCAVDENKNQMR
jgi:hypothetical protein